MSAKPALYAVAPPPADDPISIEFMKKRLALSGLVPEDIDAYPISSQTHGFTGGFCIPYPSGSMYRTRHDRSVDKYHQPKNISDIWWSPHTTLSELREADILFIVEGELKAARFYKQWPTIACVGIGGAWNYARAAENGTKHLLPNLIEVLRPGKRVCVIFDGDIKEKVGIQMAGTALRQLLVAHNVELEIFYPPEGKGVDDWLETPGEHELVDLIAVQASELEESRKQKYAALGCHLNDGKLILNEFNAEKLIADYLGQNTYIDKRIGMIHNGSASNIDELEDDAVRYMQGQANDYWKTGTINNGLRMALRNKRRDLVQEMLLATPWDGVKRLETWGSEHFETDWPAYANEWGRILMTGLALRILRPGTKVDKVCILAGAQGIGKSTFFESLSEFGGQKFYYACTSISSSAGDANRTQGMMFSRSTIVDLAEGVVFETRKQTMDMVKQVLTQSEDEYRIPYAKSATVEPRGYIFVGTTNRYDQLSDHTGSRRYMYLRAQKIQRLSYDIKLQILAEVVAQENELRHQAWWEERLRIEDAPEHLRQDNAHIKNVQELVNTQFTKADQQMDFLIGLLESNEVARLKDTGEQYVTAAYLAARSGNTEFANANLWSRKLSALSASPSFPYQLVNQRKRIPQLQCSEAVKQLYQQTIFNDQLMINGYIVRKI